jgi:hypothetical protein
VRVRPVVVLSALLLAALPSNGQREVINIPGEGPCGLEGSAQSAKHKELNRLKNRFNLPEPSDFDTRINFSAMLAPGDDTSRWNPRRAATLTGFVVAVQVGGVETCNCKTEREEFRDTHIALAASEDATAPTKLVHVEVTPRLRERMAGKGINWSTDTLGQTLRGKWVTVKGWLLFDFIHARESENTDTGDVKKPKNWRATAWEIHPITSIEILPGAPVFMPNGLLLALPAETTRPLRARHQWVRHRDLEQRQFWVTRKGDPYGRVNPYRVPPEPMEEEE